MFNEKQFQAWRAQRPVIKAAERGRIRSDVETEVVAVMDGPAAEGEIRAGREHFAAVLERTGARRPQAPRQAEPAHEPSEVRSHPAAQTRAQPQAPAEATRPKVGDVKTYTGHGRFRFNGATWDRIAPAAA